MKNIFYLLLVSFFILSLVITNINLGDMTAQVAGNPVLYYCPKTGNNGCVSTTAYRDYIECTAKLGGTIKTSTICYSEVFKSQCDAICPIIILPPTSTPAVPTSTPVAPTSTPGNGYVSTTERTASDTVKITIVPNIANISDINVAADYCASSPAVSFNWKFNGNAPGDYQESFQIIVSEDPSLSDPIIDYKGGSTSSYSSFIGTLIKYSTKYYWKIIVWDQNGDMVETDIQEYTVKDKHPLVDFSFLYSYQDSFKIYKFTDLSTPSDEIASRLWDFGDGATSAEIIPEHKYLSNGRYNVKLTVIDKNGNSCSKTKSLDYQRAPIYQEINPW